MTTTPELGPIVVGIDGSPPSLAALRWAAGQCSLQSLDLHVVVAWSVPSMLGWPVPSRKTLTRPNPRRRPWRTQSD